MKLLQLLMILIIMAGVLRTVVGAEVGEVGQRLDKSVMVEALVDVRERPAEVSLLPAVQAIPPRRAAIAPTTQKTFKVYTSLGFDIILRSNAF